jgi:hypothetical protein
VQSLAKNLTLLGACDQGIELPQQMPHAIGQLIGLSEVDLLIGEIHRRLDERADPREACSQRMNPTGELSLEGSAGQPSSGFRGALDQVRDRLGLDEVDPTVQKGPLAELAGTGGTGAKLEGATQQEVHHDRPAVSLKLEDILAREGVGCGKKERNSLVDLRPISRQEGCKCGSAGSRETADDPYRDGRNQRAGDPDDAHTADPRRRG